MRMKVRNEKWEQSYKLTKKRFFYWVVELIYKMNYYWFSRQEILQKAKEKDFKEKAGENYK